MLVLPIKRKWFDMIRSGEKKEEYREIKPYYTTRFANAGILNEYGAKPVPIIFRNGYRSDSPQFTASCRLRIGKGKPEWGAVDGEEYYILEIVEVAYSETV